MRKKIAFVTVLFMLLLIVGVLGKLAYDSYRGYDAAKRDQEAVTALREMEGLLRSLQEEALISAVYLGSLGEEGFRDLKKVRQETDRHLVQTSKIPTLTDADRQILSGIAKSLRYFRSGTDALNNGYRNVWGVPFEKEILHPLNKRIRVISLTLGNSTLRGEVSDWYTLIGARSTLAAEEAYLLYLVRKGSALEREDLDFWEHLLEQEGEPAFRFLRTTVVGREVSRLTEKLDRRGADRLRARLMERMSIGHYQVTPQELATVFGKMTGTYDTAGDRLISYVMTEAKETVGKRRRELIQYLLAALFAFGVLLFYLRNFSRSTRERRALEESIREIISDLDPRQQEEIRGMMAEGDPVRIYRFLSDTIKEAMEAKERALEAERAKDLFLANMSHEIRTPLNGILGFLQLLEGTRLTEEQKGYIDIIKGSSGNLLAIVNSILDLSKIRADKVELEKVVFSPIEVFSDAVEPHEVHNAEKKISYTTFIDPTLPLIEGDPTRLRQILNNLIGNAVKFTDVGGSIETEIEKVAESDDEVRIRFLVRDNGIGITKEKQEEIFEAFSQADNSMTRRYGGTGLGLTITRDLIRQMGGELHLESEVGKGSVFYFELRFPKKGEDPRYRVDFRDLRIAYYRPGEVEERTFDRVLIRYLEATGADLNYWENLEGQEPVDIVMCDHALKEVRHSLPKIMAMPVKTILIGYLSYKEEIDGSTDETMTALYRPVTFPKLIRALEHLKEFSPEQERSLRSEEEGEFSGLRILVVEDNGINQRLIEALLREMGIEPTIASNGKEGVEYRKKDSYDLILMDIQMPVMGGMEATGEILAYEKREGLPHIPIVALTANALRGDRERYLEAGMDEYLSKPIDVERLRELLRRFCRTGVTRQEHPVLRESRKEKALRTSKSEVKTESSHTGNDQECTEKRTGGEGILLLTRSGLMEKLHRKLLGADCSQIDVAESPEIFIRKIGEKEYRYLVVDPAMIDANLCSFLEVLGEMECPVMTYRSSAPVECLSGMQVHETIRELRTALFAS